MCNKDYMWPTEFVMFTNWLYREKNCKPNLVLSFRKIVNKMYNLMSSIIHQI